jgi:purine nucleosidase
VKKKVIFDTDPGVDDAMALLFLHLHPDVDLVGITTTFGNGTIDTTTRNALYLCERFGIEAPVAKGAARPLLREPGEPPHYVHGRNALGDVELPPNVGRTIDARPAHRFLADLLRANPGEISIVAVGRMTNLALALRETPEVAGLARQVVIMGGAFGFNGNLGNVTPCAEANIHGDPDAADEVLGGAWPVTMVGLDVTQQTRMSTAYLEALAEEGGETGELIWRISRFYEAYHRASGVPEIFVHDSSAVACLLDPSLFEMRPGSIRVVRGGIAAGQTIQKPDGLGLPPNDWDHRPSHRICTGVNAAGLLDLYRRTITRGL